ncbi:hypothetical protein TSTA_114380 [Talaromyces stipitatus ATCC 10500]|uniref:F-box domain-containing protein n=1 Tax=Talaromyces stipitatus (strain ATCC 10500 / CBS 375.48 / QM 6759 / NRRL 1006) TaxID=441959 RepID=B8MDA0_TALSN|nr:uncharacterized protein TSTA_114380 [Talaromyces stipitatus ATCC 10500]EED17625.1 hypothetical protein TSTA_114380 [Talaromyces stipitatus ATCC 10500]
MPLTSKFPSPSAFERLPFELNATVLSYLSNKDIKNLRLTSKAVKAKEFLRLKRSRNQITEIVWDDVRLSYGQRIDDKYLSEDEDSPPPPERGVPYWYVVACQESKGTLIRTKEERKVYYQQLLPQQDEMLVFGADIEAYRSGLEQFPHLKRITLTAATCGVLDHPMYATPMIRDFPPGFTYPADRATWPVPGESLQPYECSIIPIGKWKTLRPLGLSGVIVDIDELISMLAAQPATLRSVELSYLFFRTEGEFGYYHLLDAMCGKVGWKGQRKATHAWPFIMGDRQLPGI